MKLYAKTTSEKGKTSGQGGNESLKITLSNGNIAIFDITFTDDGYKRGKIDVMSYHNGETNTIGYCEI